MHDLQGGSDGCTPYTVGYSGVTLPQGQTYPSGGHVNYQAIPKSQYVAGQTYLKPGSKWTPQSFGMQFDPNNNQPGGVYIGRNFFDFGQAAAAFPQGYCIVSTCTRFLSQLVCRRSTLIRSLRHRADLGSARTVQSALWRRRAVPHLHTMSVVDRVLPCPRPAFSSSLSDLFSYPRLHTAPRDTLTSSISYKPILHVAWTCSPFFLFPDSIRKLHTSLFSPSSESSSFAQKRAPKQEGTTIR